MVIFKYILISLSLTSLLFMDDISSLNPDYGFPEDASTFPAAAIVSGLMPTVTRTCLPGS